MERVSWLLADVTMYMAGARSLMKRVRRSQRRTPIFHDSSPDLLQLSRIFRLIGDMAWDLNLCTTRFDSVQVPFGYFAKPQAYLVLAPIYCFPQFLRLPTDIQLIIYECCDAATLFQLMRTCSRTRAGAVKIFWADRPEAHWYHCNDYELFEYRLGQHPIIRFCPEFASRITRVEIDLIRLEIFFVETDDSIEGRKPVSVVDKAQVFWRRVEMVFPAVRRIVLTGCWPGPQLPPPEVELDGAYHQIELVVQQAPPSISVQIAFDDGFRPVGAVNTRSGPRFTLWQVASGLEPRWQIVHEEWTPTRVLLPPRNFDSRPLGRCLTMYQKFDAIWLEEQGLAWLTRESHARYAVAGAITCPHPDCTLTFAGRRTWARHLTDSSHDRRRCPTGDVQLRYSEHMPAVELAVLKERKQRVDVLYRQVKQIQLELQAAWGERGTEQRRQFEADFFAQLREENLVAPGELDVETCPWMDSLHMYLRPLDGDEQVVDVDMT